MHLILAGIVGLATYYKGNWREWSKYALTIFYVIILNLLYEVICMDKRLWVYTPDFFPKSQILTTLLYSFVILPGITLMFLSNYPHTDEVKKQIFYIVKWIFCSFAIESIYLYFDKIILINGYKHWMEPLFYIAMYSIIRLHHTRPLFSYVVSIVIIISLLTIFKIPIK
jgi:hypothetical protein